MAQTPARLELQREPLTCHYCTSFNLFNERIVSISITEIIVVFVVALLLFGPEQLPAIARGLGKLSGEIKKTSDSLRREFYNSVYTPAQEVKRDIAAEGRSLRALKAEVLAPPAGTTPASVRPQSSGTAGSTPSASTSTQTGDPPNVETV